MTPSHAQAIPNLPNDIWHFVCHQASPSTLDIISRLSKRLCAIAQTHLYRDPFDSLSFEKTPARTKKLCKTLQGDSGLCSLVRTYRTHGGGTRGLNLLTDSRLPHLISLHLFNAVEEIIPDYSFHGLQSLHIQGRFSQIPPDTFWTWLEGHTLLQHLMVQGFKAPSRPFPSGALPQLRTLEADVTSAEVILPDREISTFDGYPILIWFKETIEGLVPLFSAALLDLSLRISASDLEHCCDLLRASAPRLQKLDIGLLCDVGERM